MPMIPRIIGASHSRMPMIPRIIGASHSRMPMKLAGMPGLRRFGLAAGSVVGTLIALDLIGFVATVWFGAELAAAAEAAGLAGWVAR